VTQLKTKAFVQVEHCSTWIHLKNSFIKFREITQEEGGGGLKSEEKSGTYYLNCPLNGG